MQDKNEYYIKTIDNSIVRARDIHEAFVYAQPCNYAACTTNNTAYSSDGNVLEVETTFHKLIEKIVCYQTSDTVRLASLFLEMDFWYWRILPITERLLEIHISTKQKKNFTWAEYAVSENFTADIFVA